jgi:hypothetical protein
MSAWGFSNLFVSPRAGNDWDENGGVIEWQSRSL